MIRIAKDTRMVFLRQQDFMQGEWEHQLAKTPGVVAALITECVCYPEVPLCPVCVEGTVDAAPVEGAGLLKCPECNFPFVALRFIGEPKGVVWYTFPWPR